MNVGSSDLGVLVLMSIVARSQPKLRRAQNPKVQSTCYPQPDGRVAFMLLEVGLQKYVSGYEPKQ